MLDPDAWRALGVHWHAYSGTDCPRDRADRLATVPETVLHTPDEVADWIAARTREQIDRRSVRLLPLGREGWGSLGDVTSTERDMDGDHLVASRGDSLYVDIPRQSGRWHLWAEAVTTDECQEMHDEQE